MTDETIQLLLNKNIPIVTTFAPLVMQSQPEVVARKYNIPEWKTAERQRVVADCGCYEGLVKTVRAGVAIVFGTDDGSPVVGHDVIAPEMKFMVELGVVPDNYGPIRSATIRAACLNKLDVAPNKLADAIVVDGNPLEDLDAPTRVKMIFCEGKRLV